MAVVKLTAENFEKEVLQSEKPVLVDFYADWCGPCQMVGPILEEVAEEVTDAKICKVDVDANPELAREFLTSYCNNNAETVRDAWWDLLFRLIQENAMGKVYDLENKTITNFAPSQEWVDKMMEVSGKTDVWW